jgi:SPP1 gp7 family putative phage head morphogenesis protein
MPQIAAADREALLAWLSDRSVTWEEGTVLPRDLRPAQGGYWPENLEVAREHQGPDRPILVSRDWFILDGHHQWLAAVLDEPGQPVPVIHFSVPIRPLINVVRNFGLTSFKNARMIGSNDNLARALRSGRVWYADGTFTGKFTAALSGEMRAMGAKWDPAARSFRIALDKTPFDVRQAIAESQGKARELHKTVADTLRNMEQTIPTAISGLDYRKAVDRITEDLQRQYKHTVVDPNAKGGDALRKAVSVPVQITPEMRAAITRDLTENLDLYVKNFAQDEVRELRGMAEQNAFSGARTDKLARLIEARWGVSKRKAKFLADQETSLLVSNYREQTYKRIGVSRYMWSTARDERVRPEHRALDGKIFAFDQPPPSGPHGEHQNPGEPYGCRCTAVPILELPGVSMLP